MNSQVHKMRTALLADRLVERGHSVIWWASAFEHQSKRMMFGDGEVISISEGYSINTIKGMRYKKNVSMRRYLDHRIIARKFSKRALLENAPDIIVASMPSYDLAYEAVRYGRERNIPVIIDVRDQWPDIFEWNSPKYMRSLVKRLLYWDYRTQKEMMRGAFGITSMMRDLLDWSLKIAGRDETENDGVFYLGEKRIEYSHDSIASNRIDALNKKLFNKFVVTFVGTFNDYYDPQIIIDVAAGIHQKRELSDIHFVLGGDGQHYEKVRRAAAGLDNVTLSGWLTKGEMDSLLKMSKIGICPCTRLIKAFPNKVYSYLSAGLPVISSVDGDFRSIGEKSGMSIYYEPNDRAALCDAVIRLYSDESLRETMSASARKVFNDMFDAEKIYVEYAKYVERCHQRYQSIGKK